jgi:hypothetical protein
MFFVSIATLLLATYSFESNSIHIRIQIAPYDQSGRMGPSKSLLGRNVTSSSIVKKLRWKLQVACDLWFTNRINACSLNI